MSSIYDYRYQKVRKRLLASAQSCAICGRPLVKDAKPRSRWSSSVDHCLPVSATRGLPEDVRRELATDVARLRVVHLGCNSKRGNGRRDRPRHTSRSWV